MIFNNANQMLEEFTAELFIVEGKITDLITRETLENINAKSQSTMEGIAAGSALLGQLGSAALAGIAASDDGIDVSEFAIELTDHAGVKHLFKGCFPEVVFKNGDQVKVIAHPFKTDYSYVSAIIDIKHNYMWTSQQVERGRYRYRVFCIKSFGLICLVGLVFIFLLFGVIGGFESLRHIVTVYFCVFTLSLSLLIGWRVGASFDEQSIELEAILKKLGFYKPTMMSLNKYSIFSTEPANNQLNERWKDYTYRIDLAQKDDAEKYGKK